MKLDASFSPRLPTLTPILVLSLVAVVGVMITATLIMVSSARHLNATRPILERELATLSQRQPVVTRDQPSPFEVKALQRRVAALNRLSAYRGSPLPALLARLEPLLPAHAFLVALRQRPETGEVDMTVEAATSEPLTLFLTRLQRDARFVDVLLTKQSHPGGGGARLVQFQLRLQEREG